MTHKITTAVFPVGGLGTRFLPVTKAGPKEMLHIIDRPLIQYVVEEALNVGITQLVFVTSSSKRAIEDYFDTNYELESYLEERGNYQALATVKNIIPAHVSVVYVRQPKPLGLGDAVLRAKHVVGNVPFAVLLADDVMDLSHHGCLQNMMNIYQETQSSVLAVEEVPKKEVDRYGIVTVAPAKITNKNIKSVLSIIEKPHPTLAPSNLAVTGRYILTPRIFTLLSQIEKGVGGEVQLTDAISRLLAEESIHACSIEGARFDCGTPSGLLKATVAFAMKQPELRETLEELFKKQQNLLS